MKIECNRELPLDYQDLDFDNLLLSTVKRVFVDVLGNTGSQYIFSKLESQYDLEVRAIPREIERFVEALVELLGTGGGAILSIVIKEIADELHVNPPQEGRVEEQFQILCESCRETTP
ncbi:MAG: hypothetical protein PVJ38_06005 [Candidatus Bathyarchaeota archaeon]|jgi:hypothetical protein